MNEHLILHKVRGEPAFDIAISLKIGDEDGWIIPTSGWRVYPWSSAPLKDMGYGEFFSKLPDNGSIPADWPDMYGHETEQPRPALSSKLLDLLGLVPKIKRRA